MLGRAIHDPARGRIGCGNSEGIGLLESETMLVRDKVTKTVHATTAGGTSFSGVRDSPRHHISARFDAAVRSTWMMGALMVLAQGGWSGTYLHGALEDAAVCSELLGISVDAVPKAEQYERLAEWFDRHARHAEDWLLS